MSERAEAQARLLAFLVGCLFYNAPYGATAGLRKLDRGGYVRTVMFGRARTLDAVAYIWKPNNITVSAQGGLAWRVSGQFDSVEELIDRLSEVADLRKPEIARYSG